MRRRARVHAQTWEVVSINHKTLKTPAIRPAGLMFCVMLVLSPSLSYAVPTNFVQQLCTALRTQVAAQTLRLKKHMAGKQLCFETCTKGEIPAAKFWGRAQSSSELGVRGELLEKKGFNGWVSKVDLNGDDIPEVRIARRVGAASCVSDTYLQRIPAGYLLLRNPSLNRLSEEGRNCGHRDVAILKFRSKIYAVETGVQGMEAYRINDDFKLTLACRTPLAGSGN